MNGSKKLIFIRRNTIFNDMVISFIEKHLNYKDYITISEYKNADIYIDLKKYDISNLNSNDWRIISKELNVEEIILKDRLLRNINYIEAKELLFKAIKFFIELFKTKEYDSLVTYPVDNYITDIMIKIANYYHIETTGISNFFIQGYKRVTVYGEHKKVREVSNEEVETVFKLLQKQYKSYMALSFSKSLKSSILYYFKYKIKYLHFFIFNYLVLGKLEYDYRSTLYFSTVNNIKDFFPFKYFTNSLPNKNDKSIYIPMHYHPEATIEHWSDSIKNVDYINSLFESVRYFSDKGWKVYLKEHPAMCFRQDIVVYKKLKKIDNVYILNPFIETANVMDVFDNFAIWTGSTGIEALVNDKIVYFASSNYYFTKTSNELFEKVRLRADTDKKSFIKNILENTIEWK